MAPSTGTPGSGIRKPADACYTPLPCPLGVPGHEGATASPSTCSAVLATLLPVGEVLVAWETRVADAEVVGVSVRATNGQRLATV